MIYTFFFSFFHPKQFWQLIMRLEPFQEISPINTAQNSSPALREEKSIFVPPPCVPLARLYQGVILDSQRALAFLQSISTLFVFCSKMLGPILKQILSSKTFNLVRQNRSSVAIPGSSALKIWLLSNFKRLQPVKMPNLHW